MTQLQPAKPFTTPGGQPFALGRYGVTLPHQLAGEALPVWYVYEQRPDEIAVLASATSYPAAREIVRALLAVDRVTA
jgi:hypothetical protein